MVKLVSMNVKRDYSVETASAPREYDASPCIYLSDEQVSALGLKGLPKPGTTMSLAATAVVQSVSASDHEGAGKPSVSLSLRLTEMAIEGDKPDTAKVLYGE